MTRPTESVLFLPQKPYLPLGTLRQALIYPQTKSPLSDAQLRDILSQCRLEELRSRLDEFADWTQILSLGEQERIAFARVLVARPVWLFLDEATAALDEQTERHLYTLVRESLPETAIISVGHRSTLTAFHEKNLSLEGGAWTMRTIEEKE